MPLTRTIADLQRNMGEVSAVCHETGDPVYLTKTGVAALVIMDAAAFEAAMDLKDLVYEREMRTLSGIARGCEEISRDLGKPYSEIRGEMEL